MHKASNLIMTPTAHVCVDVSARNPRNGHQPSRIHYPFEMNSAGFPSGEHVNCRMAINHQQTSCRGRTPEMNPRDETSGRASRFFRLRGASVASYQPKQRESSSRYGHSGRSAACCVNVIILAAWLVGELVMLGRCWPQASLIG